MALSATSTSICNKLVSDYNSLAAPIYMAKAMVRQKMAAVETMLRGMAFTPIDDLNIAIAKFQNDISAALPKADMAAMNELKQFIDQCTYMDGLSPMSAIMGTAAGVNSYMNKLISETGLPEFGASSLFSGINDSFGAGGGVTNSFAKSDELLNCLSSICGAGYAGAVGDIENDLSILYVSLNVVGNPLLANYGKFDTEAVYTKAGLAPDEITSINNVTASIDGAKTDSKAAIEASASKVKELTKAGDFF